MAAKQQQTPTQAPQQDVPSAQPVPPQVQQPPAPEKTLFAWRAAARPFKRRDREFWMTVLAIAGVLGFIIFIVEGIMPVLLIIAVIFLFYVLTNVEPEQIEYTITTWGVRMGRDLTQWDLLLRYWFVNRLGSDLLVFEIGAMPGRLELVINDKDKPSIEKTLSKYIIKDEAVPSNMDRAADWFSQKFPGNK